MSNQTSDTGIDDILDGAMENEWRKILEALGAKFGRAELAHAYLQAISLVEEQRIELVQDGKVPNAELDQLKWKWMGVIDERHWPLHRTLLLISRLAPQGFVVKVLKEQQEQEKIDDQKRKASAGAAR